MVVGSAGTGAVLLVLLAAVLAGSADTELSVVARAGLGDWVSCRR